MQIETHGRWPLVGAAGLVPISMAASRRPGLRPLAALLWRQTEEWVWPGAFLPWINREVLDSDEDEFPIDRRLGFIINVVQIVSRLSMSADSYVTAPDGWPAQPAGRQDRMLNSAQRRDAFLPGESQL